jgi:hypothetical protein
MRGRSCLDVSWKGGQVLIDFKYFGFFGGGFGTSFGRWMGLQAG